MARERKDYDSAGFLEKVRQQSVPTYHTSGDGTSSKPPEQPPEQAASVRKSKVKLPPTHKNEIEPQPELSDLELTTSEIDYIKTFVATNNFGGVNRQGKPIIIRENHRRTICDIFYLLGETPNMAQYIDNVLTEHFKQYYPLIRDIYQKCPPKF